MKTIVLSQQEHNCESRLTLRFSYDAELNRFVRSIEDIKWSNGMHCYHLEFNQATVSRVISLLRGKAEIDISQIESKVKLDKVDSSFEKSKDSGGQEQKEEATTGDEDYFIDNKPWNANEISKSAGLGSVRFSINMADGGLSVKFLGRYESDWIRELKSYGKTAYDSTNKVWMLTWSQIAVDSLADYFGLRGIKVIVEKVAIPELVKDLRVSQGLEIRDRILNDSVVAGLEKVRDNLKERRYSKHTIEAYISLLEVFFKYYNQKDPIEISHEDITTFFKEYVVFHKYSSSYQNQLVSAIKVYYKVNGQMRIASESLSRPRRGRTLPKVFSKEEVQSILNAGYNLKHKLILWMIYSCGLRRSEVINIKLKDFDRDRGVLNIREAKGMVDRIVPVSKRVWSKIDEYLEAYKPIIWLFEGAYGGKYSVESVYRVFKEALRKTGINKDVGVHSLRHSYATHLHESGLDIRYIQELLGHKSTRTTEIYTHVSRRNLIAIKSPIEDLDLR